MHLDLWRSRQFEALPHRRPIQQDFKVNRVDHWEGCVRIHAGH